MHNRLNTGWNFNAGAGMRLAGPLGARLEFMYDSASVADQALAQLNVPGGNARIYSVTIDPELRFRQEETVGGYLIAGGGWYRRTVDFTQPTTAVVPFYDPWFGYFGSAVVPADQIIGSYTVNTGGFNAGGGLTFRLPGTNGAKLYTEARYHWMNAGTHNTSILPITIGLRW